MTNEDALSILSDYGTIIRNMWFNTESTEKAFSMAVRALRVQTDLQNQIALLKRTVKSENSDYLTGYVCALSAVEGMINN